MTRTSTPPPTDKSMWCKLKARAHPDGGGDHELFIWAGSVEEVVCGSQRQPHERPARESPRRRYPSTKEDPDRIPYPPGTSFREVTKQALQRASTGLDGYGRLLALLEDCWPLDHLWREQRRGASYKRLAAIGHMVGMTKAERVEWYRVAESIPLSDRHAGHILSRLKRRATT
jgi:hypothetical protein